MRSRIGGVKKTQKITKAMKMVAAAKLRRAQRAVVAARPYARGWRRFCVTYVAGRPRARQGPLLTAAPVQRVGVVVITSDRGLCGAFNTNIIKAAVQRMASEIPGSARGRARQRLLHREEGGGLLREAQPTWSGKHSSGSSTHLQLRSAQRIAADADRSATCAGEFDRVDLVYNEFKSIAQQRIVVEQFLPVVP